MASSELNVLAVKETVYFSHAQGALRQWIEVTLESAAENTAAATVWAGGEQVETTLSLTPGVKTYRCYAPVLWPARPPEDTARLRIVCGDETLETVCPVGHHRPWVLYALSDVCTDATWVYDRYEPERKDDADLTAAELALSEATRGGLDAEHNRYNLVHALELEYFEEFYPDRVTQLAEAMRLDEITLNPFYNMTLSTDISLEEQIRLFYKAREWAVKFGLEMKYANHQETPSIAWDMAGILAGCGVDYLVKGILPYECPWAARLEEPPVFLWEGPDGAQIKMRRRNRDYVEAMFLLKGLEETANRIEEQVIPEFEAWGARYPFNAAGLVGVYGDLVMAEPGKLQSRDFPLLKASTIARYNAQGWEYPRLVNASHGQFWREIDTQIAARGIELEVYRGDYGVGWDTWPACLAYDVAGWRRAQERSALADRLAAVLVQLDNAWYIRNRDRLAAGWKNLKMLADHAWNGANDANRILNARLRREWQTAANAAFDQVVIDGIKALAGQVQATEGDTLLVFNGLGWERDGLACWPGAPQDAVVVDALSGESLPTQRDETNGQLTFLARAVPSVGYRTYRLRSGVLQDAPSFTLGTNCLEGPFYLLEVSPITGGITRLYDKIRGVELVDPDSSYHLNQCLFFSDGMIDRNQVYQLHHPPKTNGGTEHTSSSARIEAGEVGPLSASLVITTQFDRIRLKSTITLYAHLDRVDIRNEVHKTVSEERQQLDFAFPFHVPGRQFRLENPGAILDPERDMRPGAGLSAAVVRHFVDVFNAEYGVTMSMADSFSVQFGRRTTTEDPQTVDPSATLLATALGNIYDANEAIRDQAGVEDFVFRFSLRGHAGGFDPAAAVRFGWEDNNALETAHLPGGVGGSMPARHSFVTVEPATAILAGMKVGEEGGTVLRFWETGNLDEGVRLRLALPQALSAAQITDHLERVRETLPIRDGEIVVPLRPRGVTTARFL